MQAKSGAARAEGDLEHPQERVITACVHFIFGSLAREPYRVGRALRRGPAGLYSADDGATESSTRIDDVDGQVEIMHIDRRSDMYRWPVVERAWDTETAHVVPAERSTVMLGILTVGAVPKFRRGRRRARAGAAPCMCN